jgi:hypothetical protein
MAELNFRQELAELGFNQSSFTRRLIELGDPRPFATLLRSVQNYAIGTSSLPGEMVVILGLMRRYAAVRGRQGQTEVKRGRKPKAASAA